MSQLSPRHTLGAGASLHVVPDVPDDDAPHEVRDEANTAKLSEPGRHRPPWRRRRWWLASLFAALVAVAALVIPSQLPTVTGAPGDAVLPPVTVFATVPYWNLAGGTQSVIAHRSALAGVSPWMYGVRPDGAVVSLVAGQRTAQATSTIDQLQTAGVPLIPTISNTTDGAWDYPTIAAILHDPTLRARHEDAIVALVAQHGYAGIDVDYENLLASDRADFSAFITELGKELHAAHKLLSVDVFAKATDAGYDQRNVAQDYSVLGKVADQIRLMAYDWHWSSSGPGAIAPLDWVRAVLQYAVTQIPRSKIVLGIPMYGYDWVGDRGTLVSWLQAYGIAKKYGAVVHWDVTAQTPWLTYDTADGAHVVWFENAYSSAAKLALAREFGVHGVYLWLPGDEDTLVWTQLAHDATGPSGPAAGGAR